MTTTALITGGTSGISRGVAHKLARLGIHVSIVGRNEKPGEETLADSFDPSTDSFDVAFALTHIRLHSYPPRRGRL
jgi:short-subunit dehydrogenase involved in D-alanine esterification of teichoic acids